MAVGPCRGGIGYMSFDRDEFLRENRTQKLVIMALNFLTVTINGPSLIFIDSILRHTRLVQPTPTHQTWSKEQSYASDTFLDV